MDIELLYYVFFRICVDENNVKFIIFGIVQSSVLVNQKQYFLEYKRDN